MVKILPSYKTLLLSGFLSLIICFIEGLNAQDLSIIKGTVTDNKKVKQAGISVLLLQKSDSTIVAFSETNKDGSFQINYALKQKTSENFLLKVQALGYVTQIINIATNQSEYHFILEEGLFELKEVIVKNKQPIVKFKGDTTTYRADDFATAQDRTIGDVLKKIPGITVADNGQLKFNGQNVGKLYLDGDDLLESKYNLATKTLPNDVVNQIQILENHQSIKALEGKVFSDDVDINLTFKNKAQLKLFGRADIGAGLPNLYEEEANLISLKNNYKAIHSVKFNNTANSLGNDILSLNEVKENAKRGYVSPNSALSIGGNAKIPISEDRYLFNHSGLATSANLWKLKQDVVLKSKVYYEYDQRKQEANNQINILLPNNLINYTEQIDQSVLPQNLYSDIIIYKNKSDYYLNNKTSFVYFNKDANSNILANQFNNSQSYTAQNFSFSNEFDQLKTPKGKLLVQYYSFLSFENKPEDFSIDSGRFNSLFVTDDLLTQINQTVNIPTFFTNNYITLQKGGKHIIQSYKIGTSANFQKFKTSLQAIDESMQMLQPDSSANDLRWNEYKIFLEPEFEWKKGDFRITAKVPLRYQIIEATDANFQSDLNDNRLLINHNFNIRYKRDKGISANLYYIKTNSAGRLSEAYEGIVLNNYRSLSQNKEVFTITKKHITGLILNYKNPIKMIFFNFSTLYQKNNLNTISVGEISRDLSFNRTINLNNQQTTFNFSADISKYFYDLRSSVTLSYSQNLADRSQFNNAQLYLFTSKSNVVGAKWNGKIGDKLNYDYELQYFDYTNKPEQTAASLAPIKTSNLQHKMDVYYTATERLYFKANSSVFNNKNNRGLNSNYCFIDFKSTYKFKKHRIDCSLEVRNITNIKNYEVAISSLETQTTFQYPLRGRMLVSKIQFNF
ncbi:hypothetical protein [Pedobacter alpinus]|uniref:Uncharacterized protein n=1 Tax=Pedobacter alpinus TaxID=1590643 RepID=A0ABW5TMX6_9SPHI